MSAIDPIHKRLLRFAWTMAQTCLAMLPGKTHTLSVWYAGARPGNIGGPLVKVKRLQQHFSERRFGYSVVYALSNTPYLSSFALKVLKWRKVPIVLNQNGVFYGGWFDGDWEQKNREMARAWKSADHVFCQSHFCKMCAEQFLGPRQGPTEILYNAVDTSIFHPKNANRDIPVFLMTGKIDRHMFYRVEATLHGFAAAVAEGLEAGLQISGWMADGLEERCLDIAKSLGIDDQLSVTGAYSQEEAPEIYQMADVYVMLKHNDPCPNTVLEALASGVPVLYSNSGGVPELATGMAGVPLEVGLGFDRNHTPDTAEIARGMFEILKDLPTRQKIAREQAVSRFDITDWIERHRTVFTKLQKT